jgi:hypothetical protein
MSFWVSALGFRKALHFKTPRQETIAHLHLIRSNQYVEFELDQYQFYNNISTSRRSCPWSTRQARQKLRGKFDKIYRNKSQDLLANKNVKFYNEMDQYSFCIKWPRQ